MKGYKRFREYGEYGRYTINIYECVDECADDECSECFKSSISNHTVEQTNIMFANRNSE